MVAVMPGADGFAFSHEAMLYEGRTDIRQTLALIRDAVVAKMPEKF